MSLRLDRVRLPSLAAAAALTTVFLWACGPQERVIDNGEANAAFNVRIDRAENGAAGPVAAGDGAGAGTQRRAFAFEMTGVGKPPRADASAEQRAAASQAAIIEAFCQALMEARRARGETDPEFTVDFGPRLHVARSKAGEGYEIRVTLVSRGVETIFVVLDGKLQHEPYDLRQVRQVFAATNGEYALVGTDWSPTAGECLATVAHYAPAAASSALADGVKGEHDGPAAGPDQAQ